MTAADVQVEPTEGAVGEANPVQMLVARHATAVAVPEAPVLDVPMPVEAAPPAIVDDRVERALARWAALRARKRPLEQARQQMGELERELVQIDWEAEQLEMELGAELRRMEQEAELAGGAVDLRTLTAVLGVGGTLAAMMGHGRRDRSARSWVLLATAVVGVLAVLHQRKAAGVKAASRVEDRLREHVRRRTGLVAKREGVVRRLDGLQEVWRVPLRS